MRRASIGLVLALMATPLFAQTRPPQTPLPTFKSSSTLVAVTATVQRAKGGPVTALTRADFEILDNGRPRPITGFFAERSTASVALLFDRSGSMNVGERHAAARAVAAHLLAWLEAGRDEIALFGFDHDVARLQPFAPAPADILAKVDELKPFGSTSLHDAIAVAATQVADRTARRAVVVITDGVDTSSLMSPQEVSRLAAEIDVPVYVLIAAPPIDRQAAPLLDPKLEDLARKTGGRAYLVTKPMETSRACQEIASDLHHQYLIAFESDGQPGWHALDVRVKQKDVLVRARTGYVAGGTTPVTTKPVHNESQKS
jgi:Ca-activated chloride channel family protein